MTYRDWEAAAKASRFRKAVATFTLVDGSKKRKVDVIKPLNGDGWLVFASTGYPIRKATTREIDAQKRWRPY